MSFCGREHIAGPSPAGFFTANISVMERFLDKRELMYLAFGFLCFASVFLLFLYGTSTVVSELGADLNPDLIKPPEVVRFNLDLIPKLNLPK